MPANVLRFAPPSAGSPISPWPAIAAGCWAPPAAHDLAGQLDRIIELLESLAQQHDARPTIVPIADDAEQIDQSQLAEMLKLTLRTIRRMETKGFLPPSVRIARRRLYFRNEIIRWLKAGRPPRKEWEDRGRK